jgi:murein DD-endopeptidase MepM/ murein hydrolase activator NlpD
MRRGVARPLALLVMLSPTGAVAVPVLHNPVGASCISSPFGWRHAVGPHVPAGMHEGVDLPAPAGAVVRAASAGRVVAIRRIGIGGLQLELAHGDGWRTLYAHLGSIAPALASGRRTVAAGDPLGRVGRTGLTYGTHLYFELYDGGTPTDPAPLLGLPLCQER